MPTLQSFGGEGRPRKGGASVSVGTSGSFAGYRGIGFPFPPPTSLRSASSYHNRNSDET